MKKSIFSLMIGAVVALSSCSKSEEAPNLPQTGEQSATFQIDAPAATRATVTGLTRYIVEAYEGNDLATPPVRVEAATGSLTLELKKNTEYTFVFWADKGMAKTEGVASSGYYNTDKLQEVVVSAGKESTVGEVAYCLTKSFNSKDFEANKAVVLKNATAQLNFTEATGLTTADNSLTVKYSSGGKLNVATGKITEIGTEISRTYSNIGKIAKEGIVVSDYILAPLGEKRLLDLKMTFNSEPEKIINNVPLQQNYKTAVKGEFSNFYASTFTISNTVDDYENNPDVEFPEPVAGYTIGDFYMKDGSIVSKDANLTADQKANCIGIVYWLGDPTANDAALRAAHPTCTNGLVVSLKEDGISAWQSTSVTYNATINEWIIANTTYAPIISRLALTDPINKIMGYNNTKAIQTFNAANSAYKVEAIEKVAAYQAAVPTPASNSGWFLPSMKELTLLCGLDNQDTNIYDDDYGTANRAAINVQLAKITGSTQISQGYYWSSTEYSAKNAWDVNFFNGSSLNTSKDDTSLSVRVVSAF